MTLIGEVDSLGIAKLLDYGVIGLFCFLLITAFRTTSATKDQQMVEWRKEVRADLQEERKSRQDHETQMTKLLGELVTQAREQREALDRTTETLEGILIELRRLKGQT